MKIIRYILLVSLLFQLGFFTPNRLTANAEPLSPAWSPIVITSPTILTPMPDAQDPLCETYWYIIENAGGYPAYLTLNVENSINSTNKGEWRPNIPTDGFYQIDVYVPEHAPIYWGCNFGQTIPSDTEKAVYSITSPAGSTSVEVNQAANGGNWVSLGNHYLIKGTDNVLKLTDITGENDLDFTVSFGMVSFTWLSGQTRAHFPILYKDFNQTGATKVTLDNVTPYGSEGISRLRFDMDEPVTYRISGTNGFPAPEFTKLTWQYSGYCGTSPEMELSLTVPAGSWSYDLAASIAAPCFGPTTATIRIYSRDTVLVRALQLNVDPGGTLQLFQGQGFDTCYLPYIDDMAFWWNHSPYKVFNLYMGGVMYLEACRTPRLNRDWVKTVQNIGWGFIPTWVGPQAPCSVWKEKFSNNEPDAYKEGRQEAVWATTKAKILGLVEAEKATTVIYYDLESFPTSDPSCREVVKSFMKGWVEQLHEYGIKAGLYATSLSITGTRFWEMTSPPDVVWIAEWNADGYDSAASVFSLKYIDDKYWPNHERIRQYAGDHNESWGGRQLNIDSDVADTLLYMPRFPIYKPPIAADRAVIEDHQVTDIQLLTSKLGWLLERNTLYWTEDGGKKWQNMPVPLDEGSNLEKVYFLDPSRGWAIASLAGSHMFLVTQDGGASWQSSELPNYGSADPLELTFDNAEYGIIKFRFQTSQALRAGYALRTFDNGLTWQLEDLAQDDPAWDGNLPGPGLSIKSAAGRSPGPAGAIQIEWASKSVGWARVFRGACNQGGEAGYICQTAVILMVTRDGGQTWAEIHP